MQSSSLDEFIDTAEISAKLTEFSCLKILNANNNHIAIKDYSVLKELKLLEHLDVSYAHFNDFEVLLSLTKPKIIKHKNKQSGSGKSTGQQSGQSFMNQLSLAIAYSARLIANGQKNGLKL
jgi:Leucine-rich repeat (LRR) protein